MVAMVTFSALQASNFSTDFLYLGLSHFASGFIFLSCYLLTQVVCLPFILLPLAIIFLDSTVAIVFHCSFHSLFVGGWRVGNWEWGGRWGSGEVSSDVTL